MEILQGKRVALAGFEETRAREIASWLDAELAFCRILTDLNTATPASALLQNFDLLVLHESAAPPWFAVQGRQTDIPILIVGMPSSLTAHAEKLGRPGLGVVMDAAAPAELLLRATILLSGKVRRDPARGPLVVAADDDPSITGLVKALLTSDGIACETGNNGGEALARVREFRPDVLVLDVNMPQMGGFEVLAALKQEAFTANTRVILLTGAEQESDILRGFSLGAADYIVKPFNPMELLVRIRRFIRR